MSADLSIPLRDALIGASAITSALPAFNGSFPIFTRRPAPVNAPYPMILISPDVTVTEEDGITDNRPVQQRDIAVYGQNETAEKYRAVETLAYSVYDLFHRNRHAIDVPGWHVVLITAQGPMPAPVDDYQNVARVIPLMIRLAKQI